LDSLFVLLRDRLMAYETREFSVPPERVLAFLMEQRDMQQGQVAELLGITQSNVSRLLTGRAKFSPETIQKLAEHFRVSPTVFLAG
jgi:HTH-type transcriptional regulator/antitoxin HigA